MWKHSVEGPGNPRAVPVPVCRVPWLSLHYSGAGDRRHARPDSFSCRPNLPVKIAFYGRYSSDNQRDTSIEDQCRVVERWAETYKHTLVAKFSDAAVSGANIRLLS